LTQQPDLPDVRDLVELVRAQGPGALDQYAPEIDALADTARAAAFLGIKPESLSRSRQKIRADGTPYGPVPDQTFGRSPVWRYRTLVLHKVSAPGLGGSGKFRAGESGRARATRPIDDAGAARKRAAARQAKRAQPGRD
jgi:hypothetical protein